LETQGNREKRFCSGDWDVNEPILPRQAIDPAVVQAVRDAGEYVLATTGLRRTQETATLLANALDNTDGVLAVFPEFRERFAGELAGMTWEDLRALFPELQAPNDLWKVQAPERGLESIEQFLERIAQGLDKVRLFRQTVVLVAHAGSIKGIEAILNPAGRTVEEILQAPSPANGGVFTFSLGERENSGIDWRRVRSALYHELR
jgi:broad specificity phosphatase PhoE